LVQEKPKTGSTVKCRKPSSKDHYKKDYGQTDCRNDTANHTTDHSSFGRTFPFGIHHAVFDLCQVTFAYNSSGYAGEKAAQNQAENAQYQDQGAAVGFQTAWGGSMSGGGCVIHFLV